MKEWKDVPGFGGKYQVATDGSVRNKTSKRILRATKKPDEYLCVHLSDGKNAKNCMVHRLVAEAFIPNNNNYPVVNHKDGNKSNPDVNNLEWVTVSENALHAYRTGLSKVSDRCKDTVRKIAASNGAKTTCKPVIQVNGEILTTYKSVREAERITGILRCSIMRAIKNPSYSAGGFKWRRP